MLVGHPGRRGEVAERGRRGKVEGMAEESRPEGREDLVAEQWG